MSLSERERRFVDAYMGEAAGNGTEACRLAGYKGSPKVLGVQARRMLVKASVAAAIEERRKVLDTSSIADAKERREILTRHARNADNLLAANKAIDILNKMDGLYIQKHELEGSLTVDVAGARERIARSLAGIAGRTNPPAVPGQPE